MSTTDINLSKENKELSKSFPDFGAGDTVNVHVKILRVTVHCELEYTKK